MQPERKVVQRGAAPPPPSASCSAGRVVPAKRLFPRQRSGQRSWKLEERPARGPGGPFAWGTPLPRGERRRGGPILCWSGAADGYNPLGGKAVTLQFYAHAPGSLRRRLTPTAPGWRPGRHVGIKPPSSPPRPRNCLLYLLGGETRILVTS